jgi:hypothetical protein
MTNLFIIQSRCLQLLATFSVIPLCLAGVGTFKTQSTSIRPRFRYWFPDASVDPEVVKADIESASKIGAGGVEFLPFYNYAGRRGGIPGDVEWSTYGFGTPAFVDLFRVALDTHLQNNMTMDIVLGPSEGQGVPAHYTDEGLQWDLVRISRTGPKMGCV